VARVLAVGSLLLATLLLVTGVAPRLAARQGPSPAGPPVPLVSPMRIAEGPQGQLLVSDSRQDLVVALDEDSRTPIWSFDVLGSPMGIGFSANLLFVGNASTHNVEVYKLRGPRAAPTLEFQYTLGFTDLAMPGTIRTPSDIDIDKDAQVVFVLDSGNRRIEVYSFAGTHLATLPPPSSPPLLSPTAMTIDPVRQHVLVSDYGDPNGFFGANIAARIVTYTYAGDFISMIDGGVTNVQAQFARPQGLATDSFGRVFVTESARGQVLVFDRDTGSLVTKLGGFGDGPGELKLPLDLLIDRKSGDVLVTNGMLGRIEVFASAGGRP